MSGRLDRMTSVKSGPGASRRGTGGVNQRSCVVGAFLVLVVLCLGGALVAGVVGTRLWSRLAMTEAGEEQAEWPSDSATLTVAVSPGMEETFRALAGDFNAQRRTTSDGTPMEVRLEVMSPQAMVDQSLVAPRFQALAPDSSLWLNQLERRWAAAQGAEEGGDDDAVIPLGNRRTSTVIRYAASPVVIAAWEQVAEDLGWPEGDVGWSDIQQKATEDDAFRWNHPSTNHASGLLATLAEFYAGAGLTRGLTEEAATAEDTLAYVEAVEATVRFYGESEDVILQQLAAEGRDFLDAFVAQEQVILRWNAEHPDARLVAIYSAEGTLWADHPLALLALGDGDELSVTANQTQVFHALAEYLTAQEVQKRLLEAGYRPADLDIPLDGEGSPFANTEAVDWREPQTTLQIPSAAVVDVVQNVWWYTKRPTDVYLVVDTSGSMSGEKLDLTKEALKAFVMQIRGDRDRVGLIEFGSGLKDLYSLQPMDDGRRQMLLERIERMEASGETALLDAVVMAFGNLQREADREAISALVVMTDGQENASNLRVSDLTRRFEDDAVDAVVFTIAFGRGADEALLRRIAEMGDGQFRRADETDIEELYRLISTYF